MIETTKIGMVWKNLKFHHPPSQFGTLATYVQLHASFLEDNYTDIPCGSLWQPQCGKSSNQMGHGFQHTVTLPEGTCADGILGSSRIPSRWLFFQDDLGQWSNVQNPCLLMILWDYATPKKWGLLQSIFKNPFLPSVKGLWKNWAAGLHHVSRSTGQFYRSRFWLRNVIGTFR